MDFSKLLVRDRRRRAGHQALRRGGLRERDHVADRLRACHQRRDAIDAERDAAMRRRAETQRIQQEAELRLGLFRTDAEQLEHRALHLRPVDADRTAADLVAVQHHVVAARHRGLRIGAQVGDVVDRGRGEGVVERDVALRVLVPLEHREVGDPQRLPSVLDQTEVLAGLQAQRTHEVADLVVAARAEEHDVAVAGADVLHQGREGVLGEELPDRRGNLTGLVDLDVGQALRTVLGGVRGVLVDLLAAQRRTAGDAQRGDAPVRVAGGGGEHGELAGLHQFGHVHQLQRDAQIRLVRTVAAHRLGPGHARERRIQLNVHHLGEDVADHAFHGVLHVALAHEGEFHVELGEFQLAVGTQRLIAEAARDLVIAVEPRDHQDLIEQLRRLRQRVELARVHARRHQEVACTFGRGLGEDGCLDVLETACVQPAAQRLHQADAGTLLALHVGAAQVQVAVLQAYVLARVLMVVERQRLGLVEHGDAGGDHLDLAGADLGVDRLARAHHALDLQHVLVAQRGGDLEHLGIGRIHRHLHDAFVVAQVDEAHAAEVAGDIGPAAQGYGLADQSLVDEAAEMGTHGGSTGFGPGPGHPAA